ncbi:MAG TPA: nucleotidyltransferase family protein [Chloroflexota bacterium]|nr:nucleotidyltransferase family protein [Chloroflexota bacterium]
MRALTAAEKLLLAACRGDVCGGSTADWMAAFALAQRHQLSALLCAALRDAPAGDRPARPTAAWQALQHDDAAARRRHQKACRELTAVLATLWDIPTLALKGPALAARLYPDGGRLYEDLDIAIRAQDYPIARARLLMRGYRPPGRHVERYRRAAGRDLSFVRYDEHGAPWLVELHWHLHDPAIGTLDEGGIWARARDVLIDGHAVRTPGSADTLLLLALNLRRHRFSRLKTLCDVDRLLRLEGEGIDWPWLHAQAHAAGMCLTLRHTLDLARALLGSPTGSLPPCAYKGNLRRRLLARFASERVLLRQSPHPWRVLPSLVPLLSLDRTRAAGRLVYRRVRLVPEYARYRLGQALSGDTTHW